MNKNTIILLLLGGGAAALLLLGKKKDDTEPTYTDADYGPGPGPGGGPAVNPLRSAGGGGQRAYRPGPQVVTSTHNPRPVIS